MTFTLAAIIIDAADPEMEGAFWQRLLGGSITRTGNHHFVVADGVPPFVIQRAPGHIPPAWPHDGTQQMHVDLTTDDLASAERAALDAGARRLADRVYASPAGHPFCLRSA